jgi:hypothetical protein
VIRIEADGYLPALSDQLDLRSGEAVFDAKLHRSPQISGTVVSPDGKPVADADVLVAAPFTRVYIKDGRASEHNPFSPQTQTDERGSFSLRPIETDYTLVIVNELGFVQAARKQVEAAQPLKLQPWARLDGTLKVGSKPAAKESVIITRANITPENSGRDRVSSVPTAVTDADGKFVFDRLLPGEFLVGRQVASNTSNEWKTYTTSGGKHVVLESGKSAHVDLGGVGRPIVGKLGLENGIPQDWVVEGGTAQTQLPELQRPKVPEDVRSRGAAAIKTWRDAYDATDEAKAQQAARAKAMESHMTYAFTVQPDGSFRIEDVEPGTYDLDVYFSGYSPEEHRPPAETVASAHHQFVVPQMPAGRSDEVLDLGVIPIEKR